MEYVILAVCTAAIYAGWDILRRYIEAKRGQQQSLDRVETIHRRVDELEGKLHNLNQKVEVSRVAAARPRIMGSR